MTAIHQAHGQTESEEAESGNEQTNGPGIAAPVFFLLHALEFYWKGISENYAVITDVPLFS